MKAESLRIGNLFSDGAFIYKAVNVHADGRVQGFTIGLDGNLYPDTLYSITNIEGIFLTEKWLLKFGFELLPWGWVHNTLKDKAVLVRWNNKDKYWIELGNGLRIDLPYVHTLQNFFALTGNELTINK